MCCSDAGHSICSIGERTRVEAISGFKRWSDVYCVADRSIRAFNNTLISLVLIIPPVFTLALLSVSTSTTTSVLQLFVVVRILYFVIYLLGFVDKKLPLVDRSFVHRLFVRDLLNL